MKKLQKAMLVIAFTSSFTVLADEPSGVTPISASPVNSKPIKIGTGSEKGNYYGMVNDIKMYCQDAVAPKVLNPNITNGSVENLLGMSSKKFSMGVAQEDVLQYFAKTQPRKVNRNNQKIITGLHMEPAHLLIPVGYQPKEGKKSWSDRFSSLIGGEETKPISMDLLKGQTVGSWGGSIVSTKALSYFLGLNLNVVDIAEDQRKDPQIPLLLVGGHPYKPVSDLLETGKYHLVPIDYSKLESLAQFYMEANVSYMVNGKVTAVPTFGVRALLVGKSFRKEARNIQSVSLAKCIDENLADLADDPDTNPNWGSVYELEEAGGQTNWSYFSL